MKDINTVAYIIVDWKGSPIIHTICENKSMCIKIALGNSGISWKEAKRVGRYKCEKIELSIRSYY